MTPKVSVIMPAYNSAVHIEGAIDSVFAQRYEGIELIVIDDRSTDDTAQIVRRLAEIHPGIVLCRNARPQGCSGARNTGLEVATGEYISFLDSDDLWRPNHLGRGVSFLERRPEIDAVFFDFEVVDFESKAILHTWFAAKPILRGLRTLELPEGYRRIEADMFDAILEEAFLHLQSMIVRRSACRDLSFDETIARSEDRDFAISLVTKANAVFAFHPDITGVYYRHAASLTVDSALNSIITTKDHISLFTKYLSEMAGDDRRTKRLRELLCRRYLALSYRQRKARRSGEALRALASSLRYGVRPQQLTELAKILVTTVRR